jgi:hypothetical protein
MAESFENFTKLIVKADGAAVFQKVYCLRHKFN